MREAHDGFLRSGNKVKCVVEVHWWGSWHTSASAGAQPAASSSASACGPAEGDPGLLNPWLQSLSAGPPAALPAGVWWCTAAAAAWPLSGDPRKRPTCAGVSGARGSAQPRRAA